MSERACMKRAGCTCTDPDATWGLCAQAAVIEPSLEPGVAYLVPMLARNPLESYPEWQRRVAAGSVKIAQSSEVQPISSARSAEGKETLDTVIVPSHPLRGRGDE